ncbi:hypothetical protein [Lederbergia citrea]|uniref:Uncharacterized protein n=1 Tax=Lederbergia citrea TaxID=2833581 RepID=A0A942URJ1_9BACI|nr:hypothetical protein [Lederbergia citrea]MBS4179541.1 hypothetical protein [Lederbergia citrea]MBS4206209.1 hypothetical protein [Lederbergia citrea]MBS4224857.1 hypothetical protein [Lederbergia citrea]
MPEIDETLIFIKELGRLLDDYYRSPNDIKPAIVEDIMLLGSAIEPTSSLLSPQEK